jgi:hypothetical protein
MKSFEFSYWFESVLIECETVVAENTAQAWVMASANCAGVDRIVLERVMPWSPMFGE